MTRPHYSAFRGSSSPGPGNTRTAYWIDTKFSKWSNGSTSQGIKGKMPARDVSLTAYSTDLYTLDQHPYIGTPPTAEYDTSTDNGNYVYGPEKSITLTNGSQGQSITDHNDSSGCPSLTQKWSGCDTQYRVQVEYWCGKPGDGHAGHSYVYLKNGSTIVKSMYTGKHKSGTHSTKDMYYDGYANNCYTDTCGGKAHGSSKTYIYGKDKTWNSNWQWSASCTSWSGATHSWPSETSYKDISF